MSGDERNERNAGTAEKVVGAAVLLSGALDQVRREGAVEALTTAALEFEGMTDPPDPVNVETADWLRARARRAATR